MKSSSHISQSNNNIGANNPTSEYEDLRFNGNDDSQRYVNMSRFSSQQNEVCISLYRILNAFIINPYTWNYSLNSIIQ